MYKIISNRITDVFIKKEIIPEGKKDIYLYGFEIIISSVVYALIFILSAVITSTFVASVIFFVGFYLVRKFCGGFHASTYLKCHFMSVITHFIAIGFLLLFPTDLRLIFNIIVLYICGVTILLFAPVDHKNKRFIKNEYRNFRIKSCIYSCLIIIFSTLYFFKSSLLDNINIYIFAYSLGTVSATISMLSAKIININERRQLR